MRIEGEYTFKAPREIVFALLQDPEALAQAMPGATALTQVAENRYEAEVSIKIGSITGRYQGTVSVHDIEAPTHFRLVVEGRGAAGFLQGEGTIDLEESSEASEETLIHYAGETQVGGRIAQVGQRLIEAVARKVISQGLQSLEGQLQASQDE